MEIREVTAAIIHDRGRILICRRASDDECGSLWEFPGGKREEGESLEECIIREIKEEIEADIKIERVFATSIYHFGSREVHFTVFNAVITGGRIKLNVHDACRWVSINELHDYEFMPPDVDFVKKLIDSMIE